MAGEEMFAALDDEADKQQEEKENRAEKEGRPDLDQMEQLKAVRMTFDSIVEKVAELINKKPEKAGLYLRNGMRATASSIKESLGSDYSPAIHGAVAENLWVGFVQKALDMEEKEARKLLGLRVEEGVGAPATARPGHRKETGAPGRPGVAGEATGVRVETESIPGGTQTKVERTMTGGGGRLTEQEKTTYLQQYFRDDGQLTRQGKLALGGINRMAQAFWNATRQRRENLGFSQTAKNAKRPYTEEELRKHLTGEEPL